MRSDFPLNLEYIVGEPNYCYKFRDIFLASSDLRPMSLNVLLGITNRTYLLQRCHPLPVVTKDQQAGASHLCPVLSL